MLLLGYGKAVVWKLNRHFCPKGCAKLTVPLDQYEQIHVRSKSVALRLVFDFKFSWLHLTEIILKSLGFNGQCVIYVSIYEVELTCGFFLVSFRPKAKSI